MERNLQQDYYKPQDFNSNFLLKSEQPASLLAVAETSNLDSVWVTATCMQHATVIKFPKCPKNAYFVDPCSRYTL